MRIQADTKLDQQDLDRTVAGLVEYVKETGYYYRPGGEVSALEPAALNIASELGFEELSWEQLDSVVELAFAELEREFNPPAPVAGDTIGPS